MADGEVRGLPIYRQGTAPGTGSTFSHNCGPSDAKRVVSHAWSMRGRGATLARDPVEMGIVHPLVYEDEDSLVGQIGYSTGSLMNADAETRPDALLGEGRAEFDDNDYVGAASTFRKLVNAIPAGGDALDDLAAKGEEIVAWANGLR